MKTLNKHGRKQNNNIHCHDGQTKIDVKLEDETLWLTQAQMCELYQTSRTNIVEHIKHIYEEGELAMEHATNEYRKYKQRTISDVEHDYLLSIKTIEGFDKKGNKR